MPIIIILKTVEWNPVVEKKGIKYFYTVIYKFEFSEPFFFTG